MKRDMDLVRKILFEIEAHENPNTNVEITIEGHSENQVQYHLQILVEGNFVEAMDASSLASICYMPTGLTWKGHEFLDDIRDETVWKKTKESVSSKVSSVSLAIVQEVAKASVKSLLGLP